MSSLFSLVNVPTGVLIDEEGIMVRHDEDAYSRLHSMVELTRFRGHLSSWEEECHDAEKTIEICA